MNTFSEIIIYAVIALYTVGALATVSSVGKARTPVTPAVAVIAIVIAGAVIVGLSFVLWSN